MRINHNSNRVWNPVRVEKSNKGGRNMLQGKRTYIAASVIVIHQLLKLFGYDLPQEQLSSSIDVIAGIGAFIFRSLAQPKEG